MRRGPPSQAQFLPLRVRPSRLSRLRDLCDTRETALLSELKAESSTFSQWQQRREAGAFSPSSRKECSRRTWETKLSTPLNVDPFEVVERPTPQVEGRRSQGWKRAASEPRKPAESWKVEGLPAVRPGHAQPCVESRRREREKQPILIAAQDF